LKEEVRRGGPKMRGWGREREGKGRDGSGYDGRGEREEGGGGRRETLYL
jgi:hypothetical protein